MALRKTYAYRTAAVHTDSPEAREALALYRESNAKAVEFLSQWDMDNEGEVTDDPPWGSCSQVVFVKGYYLFVDQAIDSIGIAAPVTKEQYYHWNGRLKGEYGKT